MATGLGIAAGAFADNYARAMGLRSQLDDAEARRGLMKTQQEAANLQLEQQKALAESQKAIADDYKNFLDPNYDYVSGKPMEPQAGIAVPGQQPAKVDPFKDTARVGALYDRQAAMLERQAALAGKNPLEVREQFNTLRRNQFVEKVGNALSMIESGDEAGIKLLQAVYDLYPDGRKITGGKINEDGSVLLQFEQNGQAGERVISKQQLMEYGKLALNPADAAKLRFQLVEKQKDRDFESGQLDKKLTTQERISTAQNESQERIGAARNATTLQATGIEAGSRVRAAELGVGSREQQQNERELQFDLNTVGSVFNPQLQAIKDDPRASFKPEDRKKQIDALTSQMGWTEEVIRLNHRIGNRDGISARAIANIAADGMTAKIAPRITGPYLDPRTNKPNLDYAVVDNKFVIPTPKGVSFKQQQ